MNAIWQSALFLRQDWLAHGTASLSFGSTRYPDAEERDVTAENRARFLRALGIGSSRLVVSGNVHGQHVERIGERSPSRIPFCDGLITSVPSVAIATKTADCLPIFLADPTTRAVAIVHAGWKGVMAGVAIEAVRALASNYQPRVSPPSAGPRLMAGLVVAVGPSIGPCHYAIHDERRDEMLEKTPFASVGDFSDGRVDLRSIVARQLVSSGVLASNIDASAPCTACHPDAFASYFLSRDPSVGMLSAIAIHE